MMVMLSTPKTDAGLVEQKDAGKRAQQLANDEGQPVTIRNATTERVIAKVLPAKKGQAREGQAREERRSRRQDEGPARNGRQHPEACVTPEGSYARRAEHVDQVEGRALEMAVLQPEEEWLLRPLVLQADRPQPGQGHPRPVAYHVKAK